MKVTFPPDHEMGQLERPASLFTIELRREDPARDVVLSDLSSFGSDFGAWAAAVRGTGKRQAFVYVHGYNVSFAAAARQAGQLAYDLELDRDLSGVPMLYSWPSKGTYDGYFVDYDTSVLAVQHFNRFLDVIKIDAGIARINIIAHSMGNQLVATALKARFDSQRDAGELLEQLVLAAPDIPATTFRSQFLKTLPKIARRVTLYVSDNDKALRMSAKFRTDRPRAGTVAGGLLADAEPRFDVIDATPLIGDFLDHTYYATNQSMLADIYCSLYGSPANLRPLIVASGVNWSFKPPDVLKTLAPTPCAASASSTESLKEPVGTQGRGASAPHKTWTYSRASVTMAAAVAILGYLRARQRRRARRSP